MSEEKKYNEFVESLHRLYHDHKVQNSFLKKKLDEGRISLDEYEYIVNGRRCKPCTLF